MGLFPKAEETPFGKWDWQKVSLGMGLGVEVEDPELGTSAVGKVLENRGGRLRVQTGGEVRWLHHLSPLLRHVDSTQGTLHQVSDKAKL